MAKKDWCYFRYLKEAWEHYLYNDSGLTVTRQSDTIMEFKRAHKSFLIASSEKNEVGAT
jgi:hypothetical protein